MGPNGSYSELMYNDDTIYKSWINFMFTLVQKGVLVITEGCTIDSEQVLY